MSGDPGTRSPELAAVISELRHSALLRGTRRHVLGSRLRQTGDTRENRGQPDRMSGAHIEPQRRMEIHAGFQDEELSHAAHSEAQHL
jgi:hypothetical protein